MGPKSVVTGGNTESSDVVVDDTASQRNLFLKTGVTYLQIKVFRLYEVVNIP